MQAQPQPAVVSLKASQTSKLAMWDRLPAHKDHFQDVSLRSVDGQVFRAHRLVLSMASDPLFAMLSGCFAEGRAQEIPFESSSEALGAFLEFLYSGEARVKKTVLPELLRLVHQWEVLPLQSSLTELLGEHMTPELCSQLVVDCEALLVDDLNDMLERYALENFADCVRTEQFGTWPLHRMIGLLRSDDLVVESEEEVLSAVMHWHRSAPGRDDSTAALLQMVRFELLSTASLTALRCREGLTGLPGVVIARLAAGALKSHSAPAHCERQASFSSKLAMEHTLLPQMSGGSSSSAAPADRPLRLRRAFPYWWGDFGCSIRGGTVAAERAPLQGAVAGTPYELEPWAVCVHNGALLIIDGREPCCVLQWPLGAPSGRVIVGEGSTLNGVNDFSDIIDIAIDSTGDLYVLDGHHSRIVRIHDGVGEVVGDGSLVLDGTRALYISVDGSIYFIDEGGSRVQRYADGVTTVVAGGPEAGFGPEHLEDAEDIFVTRDGKLYVSDSGNNRIQMWAPGANQGVTVAGGNGKGFRLDQLNHPVGLYVTDEGIIYVADYQNHRVMKWSEGWPAGLVVAGDQSGGGGLHQLYEPIDVTMDVHGALYVADNGNARVMRWAAPQHPYERILAAPL